MFINVHNKMERSNCNGPGVRTVVWVQGCSLKCSGCFNPDTHSFESKDSMLVSDLAKWILDQGTHQVSISGGEPFQQTGALRELVMTLKEADPEISILVFSGFYKHEIERFGRDILEYIDVLVAGRYNKGDHNAKGLLGSNNQTIHLLTSKHSMSEFKDIPQQEIQISPDGQVMVSGIRPLRMLSVA